MISTPTTSNLQLSYLKQYCTDTDKEIQHLIIDFLEDDEQENRDEVIDCKRNDDCMSSEVLQYN